MSHLTFFQYLERQEAILGQPNSFSYVREDLVSDFVHPNEGYAYMTVLGAKIDSVKAQYHSRSRKIQPYLSLSNPNEIQAQEIANFNEWRRKAFFAISGTITQYRLISGWLEFCRFVPHTGEIDPMAVQARDAMMMEGSGAKVEELMHQIALLEDRVKTLSKPCGVTSHQQKTPSVARLEKDITAVRAELRRVQQQLESSTAFFAKQLAAVHSMVIGKPDFHEDEISPERRETIARQREAIELKYKAKRDQISSIPIHY